MSFNRKGCNNNLRKETEMRQVDIDFEERYIPIIVDKGKKYYPLRYILEKVLLKSKGIMNNKNYQKYLKLYDVKYKMGIQKSKCVAEDHLIYILEKSGGIDRLPFGKIERYQMFFSVLQSNQKYILVKQLQRREECLIDEELSSIKDTYGEDTYLLYKSGDTIAIYNHYYQNKSKMWFPRAIRSKQCLLKIVKHKYDKGEFTKDEIIVTELTQRYSLLDGVLTSEDIYSYLFGEDFKYYPWRYKNYSNYGLTKDDAKIIFNNYLEELCIDIGDTEGICNIRWTIFLREAKLERFVNGSYEDRYTFILECLDYSIPIFNFKSAGSKHWKNKENRVRAIKQLIHELKIDEEKIPMYITNNIIQKHNKIMYRVLTDYYQGSIYKFINDAYPNKFTEDDFYVTNLKNKFDSIEEGLVDTILREHFDIVIYNQRYTENTVKIKKMIPDWFVAIDGHMYIVEYFGLYIPQQQSSTRVYEYIKRTDEKIKNYNKINNYKKLYIYPKDLENSFEGLKTKIKDITKYKDAV